MELLLIGSHCFIRAPTRDRPSCHDTMHGPKLPKLLKPKPGLLLPQTNSSSQFMMLDVVCFCLDRARFLSNSFWFCGGPPTKEETAHQKRSSPTKKKGCVVMLGFWGPFSHLNLDHTVPMMFTYVLSCVAPATPKPKKSKLKLKDTRLPVRHWRKRGKPMMTSYPTHFGAQLNIYSSVTGSICSS